MKRILSIVLCCTLLVGSIPVSAWATDTVEGNSSVSVSTEADSQLAQDSSETAETPSDSTEPSPQPLEETPELTEEPVEDAEETPAPTEELVEDAEETPVPTEEPVDETQESSEPTEDNTFNVGTEEIEDADTSRDPEPSAEPVDETQETPAPTEEPVDETQTGYDLTTADDGSREVAAQATEGTVLDAAIFASDVHGNTSDLTSVLNGVKTSGVDYSSIGFVGDTCLTVANTTSTVQSALGDTNIAVMFSYAASHDTENSADISTNWNYSGEVEGVSDHYLVYTIRETDMQNASDATTAALAFTTWYNGLTEAEKKLPIFIMSHRPLHARRNDNAGASSWYNVISVAAESSDIVFFWGHNHTSENSVDTAAYYVAKDGDETFTVYNGDSVVPNFTYMNAGYINANNQSPARIGVATTVQITENELVFQDYNSSGTYTGTYAHNVTVEREFETPAVTLSSIAISGTTEYTVGDELALTVTATYSDGSTADVTAAATFTPAELTASGTYTVTASYGDKTDTIDVKVKLYDEVLAADGESLLIAVEAFSQGATALEIVWDDAAATVLDEKGLYTDYVVYDLALTNPGETTEYAMSLVEEMDTTNLAVYHVADDGTLTLVTHTIENDCVVFTTSLTGTFAYGVIAVPEGYTLSTITLANIPTDLFVGGSLDLLNAVITATYTKEGAEDFVRQLTVYDWDETNWSGYDVDVVGAYTAVFTYDGVTAELPIHVWDDEFTVNNVTVHVGADEYGVTEVTVAESTNENVANAIRNRISGNYVAYDITLNFEDGYETNENEKTVTLPVPDGVTAPVVYYISDNGNVAENMNATVSEDGTTVTFTTTHFSTYVVGDSAEITVPDPENFETESTTTTTKTIYKLVSSLTEGEEYLIVSRNSAGSGYGLAASTTGVSVTVKPADDVSSVVYIEDKGNALEWTASSGWSFTSGSYYLGYSNGLSFSTEDEWTFNSNRLYQSVRSGKNTYTYYLRCNNGTWSASTNSSNVYFYQKTEVETTTTVSGTYSIAGENVTVALPENATATHELSSTLTFTPDSGTVNTTDVSTTATYEIVADGDPNGVIKSIDGNVVTFSGIYGKALIKVSYDTNGDEADGVVTNYITVEAVTPVDYSIELHKSELTVATGVTADNFASGTYYTFNSTTNTYEKATEYVEGTTYYTTPVVQGEVIDAVIALKGIEKDDQYSVWAVVKAYVDANDTEGTDLGSLGSALTWTVSNDSIASIDTQTGLITFTGEEGLVEITVSYEGANDKIYTDSIKISVTNSLYTVPEDGTNDFPTYPEEGAVRFDKTATAVGNFSETGIAMVELAMTGVPYTTGAEIDVVIMLDMTGSMSDDAMVAAEESAIAFAESIVKNEDGTYNGNRIAVMAFNSNSSSPFTYWELGTITADTWDTFCANVRTASDDQTRGGTPYNDALAECQSVLAAAKTDGIGNDRQQFCVFMSDGGPTSYTYITNYDAVKAGTATAYTTATASAKGGSNQSDSNFATIATYTHEYYSTLMKDDGVTMFSVLTGLSADDYPNCATIMENIASSSDNAYVVENGSDIDALTGALSEIAVKIKEAATDVVVEDKIGDNYSINFSLPSGVTADAADGISQFYIQVVDYVLDSTTHERTDTYTVLENFTFSSDGTKVESHTVDGVICTECSDTDTTNDCVTFTDGVVTAIDGTYFDYVSNSDGEFLTWTADKITSTELALQYFAYLDNSAGTDVEDQIAAGTYYTNEYATLTYTNYNGNQVQQEFPVPQMTWNGAQVSYVFYLVNEAGQPVNRAGRVVPFAEAVYVTDVFTEAVIWNDLEQSAGLEAEKLASKLVPDVYALYDTGATYKIHVYEDENAVNLNNHFVIGTGFTDITQTDDVYYTDAGDDDTDKDDLAYTTYVFNNKSDAIKYNIAGTYIANADGKYYCKSAIIENATYTTDIDDYGNIIYTVDDLGNGYQPVDGETQVPAEDLASTTGGTVKDDGYVYYVDENGDVYTIVQKTDGTEVREGFDFSNTTVAFAVVWKPQLAPDTVVVDYGLDVVIDVITNDNMAAGVVGVRTGAPTDVTIGSGQYTAEKDTSVTGTETNGFEWTASVENLKQVRFSQGNMSMSEPVTFYYEADVNLYNSDSTTISTTSMYSSVTVIPATTIYYEDDFVDLKTFTLDAADSDGDGDSTDYIETAGWDVNSVKSTATQAQDRPGESKISAALDADNNYGYDAAYSEMSTYSMGNAAMTNVASGKYATAEFTFWGTGFDVISLTSNKTGTLAVKVTDENGNKVKAHIVDTYYGYAYGDSDGDGNSEWHTVDSDSPNALYQIPVLKIEALNYDKYNVVITATYGSLYDHTTVDGYDLYLDAIRIYDPTGNINDTANEAYKADGEGWPTYFELRNQIISAATFDSLNSDEVSGVVFIDGGTTDPDGTVSIADYTSYGPNNEVYLAYGQAVAFDLNATASAGAVEKVQLAVKTVGGTGAVEVYGVDANGNKIACLAETIGTATDMYYDITTLNGQTVVIKNAGESSDDAIVSITNVKVTYTEAQTTDSDTETASVFSIRSSTADLALATFNVEDDTVTDGNVTDDTVTDDTTTEDTETDDTVTDDTVTDDTVTEDDNTSGDDTVTDDTVEDDTTTEDTETDDTVTDDTESDDTSTEDTTTENVVTQIVNTIKNIVNKITSFFSKWFR